MEIQFIRRLIRCWSIVNASEDNFMSDSVTNHPQEWMVAVEYDFIGIKLIDCELVEVAAPPVECEKSTSIFAV